MTKASWRFRLWGSRNSRTSHARPTPVQTFQSRPKLSIDWVTCGMYCPEIQIKKKQSPHSDSCHKFPEEKHQSFMHRSPHLHSSVRQVSRNLYSRTKQSWVLELHVLEQRRKCTGSENRRSRKAWFLTDKIKIELEEPETKNLMKVKSHR